MRISTQSISMLGSSISVPQGSRVLCVLPSGYSSLDVLISHPDNYVPEWFEVQIISVLLHEQVPDSAEFLSLVIDSYGSPHAVFVVYPENARMLQTKVRT